VHNGQTMCEYHFREVRNHLLFNIHYYYVSSSWYVLKSEL